MYIRISQPTVLNNAAVERELVATDRSGLLLLTTLIRHEVRQLEDRYFY